MLRLSKKVVIPAHEIEITAVRSQGPGGQNVNKVATGVHLRFDIPASSLPDYYKHRLLQQPDQRITKEGVLVLKAQASRSRVLNRMEALDRLREFIQQATRVPKKRKPTQPSRASRQRRIDQKKRRGMKKSLRTRVRE